MEEKASWYVRSAEGRPLLAKYYNKEKDLTCYDCGREMLFRKGCTKTREKTCVTFEVRPTFFHTSLSKDCHKGGGGGGETHQHTLAKEIITLERFEFFMLCSGCQQPYDIAPKNTNQHGRAKVEHPWKAFRIDAVYLGEGGNVETLVEIFHTHLSTDEKIEAFNQSGLDWLEIEACEVIEAYTSSEKRLQVMGSNLSLGQCAYCVEEARQAEERWRQRRRERQEAEWEQGLERQRLEREREETLQKEREQREKDAKEREEAWRRERQARAREKIERCERERVDEEKARKDKEEARRQEILEAKRRNDSDPEILREREEERRRREAWIKRKEEEKEKDRLHRQSVRKKRQPIVSKLCKVVEEPSLPQEEEEEKDEAQLRIEYDHDVGMAFQARMVTSRKRRENPFITDEELATFIVVPLGNEESDNMRRWRESQEAGQAATQRRREEKALLSKITNEADF